MDTQAKSSGTSYKVYFIHETYLNEPIIHEFNSLKRDTFLFFHSRLNLVFCNIISKSESLLEAYWSRSFKASWKDSANDYIIISSNDEFSLALKGMGKVKEFYVFLDDSYGPRHHNESEAWKLLMKVANLQKGKGSLTEEEKIDCNVNTTQNKPATFKVLVTDDKFSIIEIRKFTIEKEGYDFNYLKFKLELISEVLRDNSYAVSREDGDGNLIAIKSEEELTDAINNDHTFFFVVIDTINRRPNGLNSILKNPPRQSEEIFRREKICMLCQKDEFIVGFMYRCIHCKYFENYVLCSSCESNGSHLVHHMLRWGGIRQWNEVYLPASFDSMGTQPVNIIVRLTGDDFAPTSQLLLIKDIAPAYKFCFGAHAEENRNTTGCQPRPGPKRKIKGVSWINYNLLVKNLKKIFPVVKNKTLVISYNNGKGENVVLCDQETTTYAFMEMDRRQVYVLFVFPENCENKNFGLPETNKNCRACIENPRLKCLECFNFQMCTECSRKGSHSDATLMNHVMSRLPDENYADYDIPDYEPGSELRLCQERNRMNKYEVESMRVISHMTSDPDEVRAQEPLNKKTLSSKRRKKVMEATQTARPIPGRIYSQKEWESMSIPSFLLVKRKNLEV